MSTAAALERLAMAAMNLRSVRRRINGESRHDPLPPLDAALEEIARAREALTVPEPATDGPIHRSPGSGALTPCCGRSPFELPRTDRMTVDSDLVTCRGALR